MHRLAVVPQNLLRKPFRVANSFGTFRPGAAVTVERDASNAKLLAPLLKLRGAVAGAHAGQITGPSAAVAEFGRGGCLGAASLISPG
jgi:hypothetical protein